MNNRPNCAHVGRRAAEAVMNYLAVLKICLVALVGFCFFNAIIGVFGLSMAIVSLIAVILLALWIFGRAQRLALESDDDRN
jgi:uncharacterized membrane protein